MFEVTTDGRQGRYPQNSIKASASASASGFPASNLTDGSYLNYWDADRKVPATIDLDLGAPKPASYLAINQREWSPTYNRETFGRAEDSSRIKDYRVYVSDDGRRWGQPVRTGTMPSARGVQFIDIGPQRSRYIRLEILSTWGSPRVPDYYNKLAIDELYVGHSYPYSAENPLPGEAENGTTSGDAKVVRCDACSGAREVILGGGAVTLDGVNAAEAGGHRLAIHFEDPGDAAGGRQLDPVLQRRRGGPGPRPDQGRRPRRVSLRTRPDAIRRSSPSAGPATAVRPGCFAAATSPSSDSQRSAMRTMS